MITHLCNELNFLVADGILGAGAELRDNQRYIHIFGILRSGVHPLCVPWITLLNSVRINFAVGAHVGGKLTAVRMIIEYMLIGADFATRRLLKSKCVHNTSLSNSKNIADLTWLKKQDIFIFGSQICWLIALISLQYALIERRQLRLIKVVRKKQEEVLVDVGG